MTNEFMREERYIVFKMSDLGNSLKGDEIRRLAREYAEHRQRLRKKPLECVVVEKDWPEYEPTWQAIEARANGAQPAPSFADAYEGAMEEVAIWKKRALEAEDLNRKFVAEINGPTYMGEPPQPTPSEQDASVRKSWARFSHELHRSPDAPYPGMSEAFEQHFSQSFADREWRAESATWAAAWKAAKRHEAQEQPASSEGSITAGILSGMFLSLDGHDKAQPGYEWRKGWNDAIRQAMDYAQPAPSVPDLLEPLRCACNYIDKLGGVSQQYRAMLASLESKP